MDERYSINATDFNSLLAQVKSRNVDAVLVAGHESEILNFVRQAKSLAVAPKMYSFTVGVQSEVFRKALGKDADYAFGMTAWLPSADLKDSWFGDATQFASAFKAKFNYDPDYHAASGAAGVEALVKAVEDAGSIDPVKVRDALSKVDFDSLYGRIAFNENGQIDLPQTVIQVQDSKLVAIQGIHGKIAAPKYPMPGWEPADASRKRSAGRLKRTFCTHTSTSGNCLRPVSGRTSIADRAFCRTSYADVASFGVSVLILIVRAL